MANRGARNNILAGLFVVVSLVLGVWVSFMLSDRQGMSSVRHFTVRFSVEDGAAGLKIGSPVQLAGQPVGRVKKVEFAMGADGVATAVNVQVEVRSDITLYEDAGVYLQLPLLGTLSSINISNVGTPNATPHAGASAAVEEGEVVVGHIAPPGFLAQAGFGNEQAAELRKALASMENAITKVSQIIDRSGPKLETGVSDAQALLTQLKEKLNDWSAKIDTTAANVEKASGRLDPLLTKVDSGLDSANALIKDIREVVADNREKLGQILDNVQSATGKIDQKTIDEVNAAIKDGRDALGVFSASLAKLSSLVTEETPGLRRTLAILR